MGPTLSPETSAFKLQTQGKFPEEYKLHSEHGESLKTTRAYHVHKKLFTSKLISRNVKLQMYNTLIPPMVTYASETWVIKGNMINKLLIIERRIINICSYKNR